MSNPLFHYALSGNADAVEFCPFPPFFDFLACATYTLDEVAQTRNGKLYLLEVSESGRAFSELCQLNVPGIFDLKWFSSNARGGIGISLACADGSIHTYSLSALSNRIPPHDEAAMEAEDGYEFVKSGEISCSVGSMCLSLDWDPLFHSSNEEPPESSTMNRELVTSLSDGSLCRLRFQESHISVEDTWLGHAFEAWIASYDKWRPRVVYSGGDDCNFCGWDLRSELRRPIFRDKKSHKMGVCSIQGSHLREHLLCTGSYDEVLRVWDMRNASGPIHTRHVELGGGIWRLKWHPKDPALLLAACMHNGLAIVNVDPSIHKAWNGEGVDPETLELEEEGQGCVVDVVEEYKLHTSLAYGADWRRYPFCHQELDSGEVQPVGCQGDVPTGVASPAKSELRSLNCIKERSLVATCSFYDRMLHVWSSNSFSAWQ